MKGTVGAIGAVLAAVTIGAGVAPAAGAATVPAASTSTAPPGYHRVIGAPVLVPPGQGDVGAQTACPAGTVTWGGGTGFTGGSANPGESINTSEPTGNGWEGRYNNTNSALTDDHVSDRLLW